MTPFARATLAATLAVLAIWSLQIWLASRDDANTLVFDVRKAEYVTPLHLMAPSAAVVGRLSKVDRRRGARLLPAEVEDLPADRSVVAVFVPADRAWGRALSVGVCVEAWSSGTAVTAGARLKVASIIRLAGEDKSLVHLLVPADVTGGKILAAATKDLSLSVVPCAPAPDDPFL